VTVHLCCVLLKQKERNETTASKASSSSVLARLFCSPPSPLVHSWRFLSHTPAHRAPPTPPRPPFATDVGGGRARGWVSWRAAHLASPSRHEEAAAGRKNHDHLALVMPFRQVARVCLCPLPPHSTWPAARSTRVTHAGVGGACAGGQGRLDNNTHPKELERQPCRHDWGEETTGCCPCAFARPTTSTSTNSSTAASRHCP
jgi:hypothetical protein